MLINIFTLVAGALAATGYGFIILQAYKSYRGSDT